MTDLELTKLCAEAMGIEISPVRHGDGDFSLYDPLHDDAQAMALVKKFEKQQGAGALTKARIVALLRA